MSAWFNRLHPLFKCLNGAFPLCLSDHTPQQLHTYIYMFIFVHTIPLSFNLIKVLKARRIWFQLFAVFIYGSLAILSKFFIQFFFNSKVIDRFFRNIFLPILLSHFFSPYFHHTFHHTPTSYIFHHQQGALYIMFGINVFPFDLFSCPFFFGFVFL